MKMMIAIAAALLSTTVMAEPVGAYQAALKSKEVAAVIKTQEADGLQFAGVVGTGRTYRCACYDLKLNFAAPVGNSAELRKQTSLRVTGFKFESVKVGETLDAE